MKNIKKLFVGAAALIAAGIVIAGIGMALLPESAQTGAGEYAEKTYRAGEDIERLSVNMLSADVVVEPADVSTVEITYMENQEEALYDITEEGGRLSLARRETMQLFNIPVLFKNVIREEKKRRTVYVRIPRRAVLELDMETTAGSITLSDLELKSLSLYGNSGDIWVKNISVKENVHVGTIAGAITLEHLDLQGNLNCRTNSGDVQVGLTDALENYRISADTLSGDNNLPDGYDRGGEKEIAVSTTAGNIDFTFGK